MARTEGTRSWKPWLWVLAAALVTVPALALRLSSFTHDPGVSAGLFGLAILGAAFLLAWGAEAAQVEVSAALAVAALAFITVLPEYAVDLVYAWKAGYEPAYAHYATANMTGANRLLIGIGWGLVALLFWMRTRRPQIALEPRQSIELAFLLLATLWAFTIFLRTLFAGQNLNLVDAIVLVGLFLAYLWVSARGSKAEEEEALIGPPAEIAKLPKGLRRGTILGLFVFAAAIIVLSAEPFADDLVKTGKSLGVDEFVLVQWVAPLASEAPEIIVAVIFSIRGQSTMAMGALLSSKVNQWTLLVGTLPLVYSISAGHLAGLPLDNRQVDEFLLTSAQSLFAIVLLVHMRLSWKGGLALLLLFATQLGFTDPKVRVIYALIYLGLAAVLLLNGSRRAGALSLLPRARREIWNAAPAGGSESPLT